MKRKCSCIFQTPKGMLYHPALKFVYVRDYEKKLVKVGYYCPKCKKLYTLMKDK